MILKIYLIGMKGGLKFHAHVWIRAQSKYDCFSCFFFIQVEFGGKTLSFNICHRYISDRFTPNVQ